MLSHIDIITQDQLDNLLDKRTGPAVSIFIPTERIGADIEQNPIRFKNQLHEVRDRLTQREMSPLDIDKFLKPAQQLLDEARRDFWRYQADGLAVFLTEDEFYTYRVPLELDELVVISEDFYLKPLLPMIDGTSHFYVLALDAEHTTLWQATRYKISAVELPDDVPTKLSEYLGLEVFNDYLTAYSTGGAGERRYFTSAGTRDDAVLKEKIQQFFHRMEDGITDILSNTNAPLVLAGLDHLQAMYRKANHYQYVLDESIDRNPTPMSDKELHEVAWEIVKPITEATQGERVALFQQFSGQGNERAVDTLDRVVPAAHFQRVDTLFLQQGEMRWGTFDAESSTVDVHDEQQQNDDDLLYLAAVETLKNGGKVYALDDIPGTDSPVAAILRY
ncbi:MAG: hypothetical protein L0154_16620 [Chloroflexi bacterium]|nr:hypothetical protein [Chloroflexota bacterium]